MKKFLIKRIVEPEITLYVWELIVIVIIEILMLIGWCYVLSR